MRLISAIIVSLAATGLAGARPIASSSARPVSTTSSLAIAGVRLGMAPSEVTIVLQAAGYKRVFQSMGRSWDAVVANRISQQRAVRVRSSGEVIWKEDYAKGDERLDLVYLPTTNGAVVSSVNYRIRDAAIDADRFRSLVVARYGQPTFSGTSQSLYCSRGERRCFPLHYRELPSLRVEAVSLLGRSLELSRGTIADQAWEADVNAEVLRRAPPVTKTTF